jgi:hypothetical protein
VTETLATTSVAAVKAVLGRVKGNTNGRGNKGRKFSDATLQKMSDAGKKHSASLVARNIARVGETRSIATKQLMSKQRTGRKLSAAHAAAISTGKKGKGQPWSAKRRAAYEATKAINEY